MSADDGFLSRWSRRKAQVREGQTPVEPVEPAAPPMPPPAVVPPAAAVPIAAAQPPEVPQSTPAEPPPSLDEVSSLTPSSDFTRFVARDVDPAVKNAALKKLFTDPHFNVMDGLDIYIDDYGKPDPLPPGMLRQMVQSQFLGLFRAEEKAAEAAAEPNAAAAPAPTEPKEPADEDADLRLQPHDAADAGGLGAAAPGAGEDAGREP